MKTERRHSLETNALAHRISVWIEKIKPYSNYLFGAAAVLLGIAVVSSLWGSHSAARQKAGWDAYFMAYDTSDPELMSLQRVASEDQYAGTPMQEWAYVTWADRQVLLASRTYLIDREVSKDRLRRVAGIYEELASVAGDRQVQDRARLALARVYEMQDKLDDARRQYELVQGDLAPLAGERAEQLDSPDVQTACAWLNTVELPKRSATGGAGTPGSRPDFEAPLPSTSSDESTPDTRSLEEILGGLDDQSSDDNRYSEKNAKDAAEENKAATEEKDDSTEAESPQKDSQESDASEEDEDKESSEQETSEP